MINDLAGHLSYPNLTTRVKKFLLDAFPKDPVVRPKTRALRFLEEALELVQALGITKEKVLEQVEYTFNRPVGEPVQEVGGTAFTFTALCEAIGVNPIEEGHKNVDQAYRRIDEIREKAKHKPSAGDIPTASGG